MVLATSLSFMNYFIVLLFADLWVFFHITMWFHVITSCDFYYRGKQSKLTHSQCTIFFATHCNTFYLITSDFNHEYSNIHLCRSRIFKYSMNIRFHKWIFEYSTNNRYYNNRLGMIFIILLCYNHYLDLAKKK